MSRGKDKTCAQMGRQCDDGSNSPQIKPINSMLLPTQFQQGFSWNSTNWYKNYEEYLSLFWWLGTGVGLPDIKTFTGKGTGK